MEPDEPEDDVPRPPEPVSPPKPDLRIRDLGVRPRGCSVCGEPKAPHIEIEVDGVLEYTCRECYEGQVVELAACRSCGAALEAADGFCGKCGTPRQRACPACAADLADGDRFCGKCGASAA